MGIELARAYVTVSADSTEIRTQLEHLKAEVSSMLKDISAGATALLAPFALFGKGVLQKGLEAAGYIEQVTIDLTTLLGTAEECQDTLKKLTKFAVETPFEMPQLLQVTKGLATFGIRGEELMSTIKMLGDSSGGTAEKFGMLARVYEHVMGLNKLHQNEFQQLSMQGILTLKDLAKYYGITDKAADKMVSDGKISFAQFHKILAKNTEAAKVEWDTKKSVLSIKDLSKALHKTEEEAKKMVETGKIGVKDYAKFLGVGSKEGVLSLKKLADHYGVSKYKAQQMIESGKISLKDYQKFLGMTATQGGRFADAMKKQSTTFQGLKSTLNDSIRIIHRLLVEPLLPWVTRVQAGLIALTDVVGKFVQNGGQAISFAFVGATAFATLGAAIFGASLAARFFGITLRGALLGGVVGAAVIALGAAVGFLVSKFKILETATAIWDYLYAKISATGGLADKLAASWSNLMDVLGILGEIAVTVFEAIFGKMELWGLQWNTLKTIADTSLTDMLKNFGDWVLNATEWIKAFAMNWKMLWDNFPMVVSASMSAIKDIFANVIYKLSDLITSLFRGFIDGVHTMLAETEVLINTLMKLNPLVDQNGARSNEEVRKGWKDHATATKRDLGLGERPTESVFQLSKQTQDLMKLAGIPDFMKQVERTKAELVFGRDKSSIISTTKPVAAKKKDEPVDFLKSGATEIGHFGKAIQDEMMKKESAAEKTNTLLGESKKIQGDLLDATKGLASGFGLGK